MDNEEVKDLAFDKFHFEDCHKRWARIRNRSVDSINYQEEWYLEQCFDCKYFVPLMGVFSNDYGACTNQKSKFDKYVMFEHDGCEFHVTDENYYND